MRIEIIGSTTSIIPPTGQAAIERLAYYQALGLAKKGHKILLFALEGSSVPQENVRIIEVGKKETLWGRGDEPKTVEKFGVAYKVRLRLANLANALSKLIDLKSDYDIILNNLPDEAPLLPIANLLGKPFYHVIHLPLFPELSELFRKYNTKLISISNAQRKSFPDLNYIATVYNGVDTNKFTFSPTNDDYLLYLGSIGKNKNPKEAILVALETGQKLLIGGRIKDEIYYKEEILPLIDGKQIQWVGEIDEKGVIGLFQKAKAFLFPTLWEEPFGLVMIEAMACGTPVVAFNHGAIPEVVVDGLTGYVVDNHSRMVEAVKKIDRIDRLACRKHVEKHFTVEKMVDSYEQCLLSWGNR